MKIFYLIEDLGDGSATVRFYDSEGKAEAELENESFYWNEYGVQSFEVDGTITGITIR